jgi:hypothetical protein
MAHLDHTPEFPERPDEWHMHSAAEGPPQEEHGATVNPVLLTGAFIGTVVSVALVAVLVYAYFTAYTTQLRRSRIETTTMAVDYTRYRQDWRHVQDDYSRVAVGQETVISLPLEVAMERVLERYQQGEGERR